MIDFGCVPSSQVKSESSEEEYIIKLPVIGLIDKDGINLLILRSPLEMQPLLEP